MEDLQVVLQVLPNQVLDARLIQRLWADERRARLPSRGGRRILQRCVSSRMGGWVHMGV